MSAAGVAVKITRHTALIFISLGIILGMLCDRFEVPPKRQLSIKPLNNSAYTPELDRLRDESAYLWVQLSDIHLKEQTSRATEYFKKACFEDIPTIDPSYVIVTGDISDGLYKLKPANMSEQWMTYKRFREASPTTAIWYDTLGNHDMHLRNINRDMIIPINTMASGKDALEDTRTLSLHSNHPNSSQVTVDKLIIFRSTDDIIPELNFFSNVPHYKAKKLRYALENLTKEGRATYVLAHHPMSNMATNFMTRTLYSYMMSGTLAHFSMHISGHQHFGRISRRRTGLLELTCYAGKSGWMRLWAFDNHLLSYSDTRIGKWPKAVLTYPKSARFIVEE